MLNNTQKQIIKNLIEKFGEKVSRPDLNAFAAENNITIPTIVKQVKAGWGVYDLSRFKSMDLSPVDFSANIDQTPVESMFVVDERTDEEIMEEIKSRFHALDRVGIGVTKGVFRSLIAAGNPGIGKTHSLESILESAARDSVIRYSIVKGMVKATGVYKLLYEHREKDQVLVFDDADSIFSDEVSLNLLKAALDSTKRRHISWRAETKMEDTLGDRLPTSFDFEGCVIFISNLNFDELIAKGSKLSPHLEALISRSFYLDLNLSMKELKMRILDVVDNTDMMYVHGIYDDMERRAIMAYFENNICRLREVSLRMILKLITIYKAASSPEDFIMMADATCTKRG